MNKYTKEKKPCEKCKKRQELNKILNEQRRINKKNTEIFMIIFMSILLLSMIIAWNAMTLRAS